VKARRFAWALLAGCAAGLAGAGPAASHDRTPPLPGEVLHRFVKDGLVDYAGLKAAPAPLDRFLTAVAGVREKDYRSWSPPEQIAFWLNLYNAATLRLVVDHYPVRSIRDIGGLVRGPWDQPIVRVFGRILDLNTVEHEILRRQFHEPRIHFALVCAARGCPPLRSEPYSAARLEAQLNDQATRFLAQTNKNRIEPASHTVFLSPIFRWYREDFERDGRSLLATLRPWWPEPPPADYERYSIRWTRYDWSLNELSR